MSIYIDLNSLNFFCVYHASLLNVYDSVIDRHFKMIHVGTNFVSNMRLCLSISIPALPPAPPTVSPSLIIIAPCIQATKSTLPLPLGIPTCRHLRLLRTVTQPTGTNPLFNLLLSVNHRYCYLSVEIVGNPPESDYPAEADHFLVGANPAGESPPLPPA